MPNLLKWGLVIGVVCGLTLVAAGTLFRGWLQSPMYPSDAGISEFILNVEPGTTLSTVYQELAEIGMLNQVRLATWWAVRKGYASQIQAGEYVIPAGITLPALMEQLISGQVIYHDVRIIEGTSLAEVLLELRGNKILVDDLAGLAINLENGLDQTWGPQDLEMSANGNLQYLEGYLFPDTYKVRRGESARALIERSHELMRGQLSRVWLESPQDTRKTLGSPYNLLILASIVEKETGQETERADIAQVFHNRLNKGMRLQTDPTVIYGLGEAFDGNLTRAHLRTDTPYNSYTRAGLPPTPIAIPSLASIRAAANPSRGELLYFVAKGDGSSQFSNTLDDHNKAVRRFQLRQR
ncbi:MAG: endolytic transglycosylase MltG [Pseudomonadota bacterium]